MAKELVCPEETLQKDLTGKIYVVTGTTSGIGLATVKQLAKQSATVICASRNIELARKIGAKITEETSNQNIHNLLLGLLRCSCGFCSWSQTHRVHFSRAHGHRHVHGRIPET